MPVAVTIHSELKLVVVKCTGAIVDDDWLETFPRLWANPLFNKESDKLIDTREVTSFGVTTATIFRLGEQARKVYATSAPSKTAVVAPLAEVHGVARQHQMATDGMAPETQVFWTYEEACAWLGKVPPEPTPPATGS